MSDDRTTTQIDFNTADPTFKEEFQKKLEAFQDWINENLVSLVQIYHHIDDKGNFTEGPFVSAVSGFVMSFGDLWCIATAGHVLQELDELVENPRVRVDHSYIIDSLSSNARHKDEIPFSYIHSHRHAVYEEEPEYDGLDYGFVFLPPNTRRLMQANNKRPVAIENWIQQDINRCTGFVLIGIPAEFADPDEHTPSVVRLGAMLACVKRLTDLPDGAEETEYERFIGDIGPTNIVDSLKGASGGPIIGFYEVGDKFYFWIVALQSRSFRKRYVFGCPTKTFGELALDDIAAMVDEYGEDLLNGLTSRRTSGRLPHDAHRETRPA